MRKLLWALCLSLGLTSAQAQQLTPTTTNTIAVVGTVAAITKIISNVSGRFIYITGINLIPVATASVILSSGTGTNCGTNTAALTGTMIFAAGQTLTSGSGLGVILAAPVSSDICITIGTAAAPGFISYSVF